MQFLHTLRLAENAAALVFGYILLVRGTDGLEQNIHLHARIVPLTAVWTSGTLAVAAIETKNVTAIAVPQLEFHSNNFTLWEVLPYHSGGGLDGFAATPELYRTAMLAAVSGRPASISHMYQYMSYRLQFDGPAVKYVTLDQATALNINNKTLSTYGLWDYVSWVAGAEDEMFITTNPPTNLDSTSGAGAGIYVSGNLKAIYSYSLNITECRLYDSSCDVFFEMRFPEQLVTVNNVTYNTPTPAWTGPDPYGGKTNFTVVAFAGIMEAYGRILVGDVYAP